MKSIGDRSKYLYTSNINIKSGGVKMHKKLDKKEGLSSLLYPNQKLLKSANLRFYHPLADFDKDKVPNILDCAPLNPYEHGFWDWITRVARPVVEPIRDYLERYTPPITRAVTQIESLPQQFRREMTGAEQQFVGRIKTPISIPSSISIPTKEFKKGFMEEYTKPKPIPKPLEDIKRVAGKIPYQKEIKEKLTPESIKKLKTYETLMNDAKKDYEQKQTDLNNVNKKYESYIKTINGKQIFTTGNIEAVENKWRSKIEGNKFLGTEQEYNQYLSEFKSAQKREDNVFNTYTNELTNAKNEVNRSYISLNQKTNQYNKQVKSIGIENLDIQKKLFEKIPGYAEIAPEEKYVSRKEWEEIKKSKETLLLPSLGIVAPPSILVKKDEKLIKYIPKEKVYTSPMGLLQKHAIGPVVAKIDPKEKKLMTNWNTQAKELTDLQSQYKAQGVIHPITNEFLGTQEQLDTFNKKIDDYNKTKANYEAYKPHIARQIAKGTFEGAAYLAAFMVPGLNYILGAEFISQVATKPVETAKGFYEMGKREPWRLSTMVGTMALGAKYIKPTKVELPSGVKVYSIGIKTGKKTGIVGLGSEAYGEYRAVFSFTKKAEGGFSFKRVPDFTLNEIIGESAKKIDFKGRPFTKEWESYILKGASKDRSIISGRTDNLQFHHIVKGKGKDVGVLLTKDEHMAIEAAMGHIKGVPTYGKGTSFLKLFKERPNLTSSQVKLILKNASSEKVVSEVAQISKKLEEFQNPYIPLSPFETKIVVKALKRASPEEVAKIIEARGVRFYTIRSGLKPSEVRSGVVEILEREKIPNSGEVADVIIKTIKENEGELYGSLVQEMTGRAIGKSALGRAIKDIDVRVLNSEVFAKSVVERINIAAGKKVVTLKKGTPTIIKSGEKLFDIHGKEVPGYGYGDDYIALGLKAEKRITTKEGLKSITLSEQMSRKLNGLMRVYANKTILTNESSIIKKITGHIAPSHAGRLKDISDFYFGEKANITGLKLKGKLVDASRANTHLERWLDAWGPDAAKAVRDSYQNIVKTKGEPVLLAEFGGKLPPVSKINHYIVPTSKVAAVGAVPISSPISKLNNVYPSYYPSYMTNTKSLQSSYFSTVGKPSVTRPYPEISKLNKSYKGYISNIKSSQSRSFSPMSSYIKSYISPGIKLPSVLRSVSLKPSKPSPAQQYISKYVSGVPSKPSIVSKPPYLPPSKIPPSKIPPSKIPPFIIPPSKIHPIPSILKSKRIEKEKLKEWYGYREIAPVLTPEEILKGAIKTLKK